MWLAFIIGVFIGFFAGFFLAALLSMAGTTPPRKDN